MRRDVSLWQESGSREYERVAVIEV